MHNWRIYLDSVHANATKSLIFARELAIIRSKGEISRALNTRC